MQTTVYLCPINLQSVGGSSTSSAEMSDQSLIIPLELQDDDGNAQFLGMSGALMKHLLSLYLWKEMDVFG